MNKVSTLDQTRTLKLSSLFLVSEPQNQTLTAWKSMAIRAYDVAAEIKTWLRSRQEFFRDEFDFLDDLATLQIELSEDGKKIQLTTSEMGAFSEIDASEFITHGMIKEVRLVGSTLVITFYVKGSQETKDVQISLSSLVDTYYPGTGLCCENNTFRIDDATVATRRWCSETFSPSAEIKQQLSNEGYLVSHRPFGEISAGIGLSSYAKHADLGDAAYTASSDYALRRHVHAVEDISDFVKNVSYFENDAGYLISSDFNLTYDGPNKRLVLKAGSKEAAVNAEFGKTYEGVNGISVDNVRNRISLTAAVEAKMTWRDWT